jgi:ABC-type glutathione transport system ATPase component
LKGLKWSEIPQICDDMVDLFGLEPYRERKVEKLRYVFCRMRYLYFWVEFSGGNKRKVSAALAFMANPALVFLDEPTTVMSQ